MNLKTAFLAGIAKIRELRTFLAFQIFFSFWLTFAILLGISLALPNFDARTFTALEQEDIRQFKKETVNTIRQYDIDELFERGLSVSTLNGYDVILLERDTGLFIGAENEKAKALQFFSYYANDHTEPQKRRFDHIEMLGPFLVQSPQRQYYQYFTRNVDPQEDFVNNMFDSPWVMLILLLLISSPILVWLAWKIAKPVKALRLSADAVATGDLTINPKLETEGIHELRRVGKSFNHMITSLQNLNRYQQRLVSDISHELKTPLARLQLATALIRRRNGESNELTRIENEIGKLDKMVHDLLALSRQQINQHLNRHIFSVEHIWTGVIEDAQFEIEQNGLAFIVKNSLKNPDKMLLNGNDEMLASAVENVIRNAKKYAKSQIQLSLEALDAQLFITIDDDGEGVPNGEYEEIFRPFYRVDEARTRQTGGTGLGLAIVANAVQHHQGSVTASKSPMGGLRIEIVLPLWQA